VDCLQEFSVVISRLSPLRLHCVERFKCDHQSRSVIPVSMSGPVNAGHAVIRISSDSGIRQKCMSGIPSTQPRNAACLCRPRSGRAHDAAEHWERICASAWRQVNLRPRSRPRLTSSHRNAHQTQDAAGRLSIPTLFLCRRNKRPRRQPPRSPLVG
jgi:hypothetical protein